MGEDRTVRRAVEVEYWVVDGDGRLTEPGDLVDAGPGVEREFVEPLVEVKTRPCETTAALRAELYERLGRVHQRADRTGKRLVPLATPLAGAEVEDRPSERTRVQREVLGEDFAYVRHCAGTHVHVEQVPGRVADQLNACIALDPALALVASAPYYRGEAVAASARSEVYRRRAYRSLAHQGRLWRYVDDVAEWTRRLERRFEEFERAALEAGVDRTVVEREFDPESAVWTPVQLRETFGTVEWRSPDTTLPAETVRLADHLAGVVEHLVDVPVRVEGERGAVTDEAVVLPRFEAVSGYVDAAVEEGLAADEVAAYLARMGFDVDAYHPLGAEIAGQEPVDAATARELRLAAADRLDRKLGQRRAAD